MCCQNCGAKLPQKSKFCPSCGSETGAQPVDTAAAQSIAPVPLPPPGYVTPARVPPPPPPLQSQAPRPTSGEQAQGSVAAKQMPGKISWNIGVPIFRNPVILKQLGLAIGIPFGLLTIILPLVSGKSVYTLYGLCLIAALFFFTWLFIMIVYRGRYEAEFVLDDKGALCRTQAGQAQKSRIVNALTVVLGLLSGKPAVAGAGILAQSKQQVFIRWNRLTRVKYRPRSHTILLRGGWTENIALFCTRENYPGVEQFVMIRTKHLKGD